MNKVVNIKLFGESYENSEILFVSMEKVVFKHNNEVFCEWLKDVSVYGESNETKIKPVECDVLDLSVCQLKTIAMPSIQQAFLVKQVDPFYIFSNPNTDQEFAVHSDDLEMFKKLN